MGEYSKIEWTDASWNPVTGCDPVGPGCKNCFAHRMARRLAGRYGYPPAPNHFKVTLHPNRLKQPSQWHKPRMIFVCSMSDLFHKDVPTSFILDVLQVTMECSQHTFQILTKRPKRMLKILGTTVRPFPNIWLGTSVENQWAADKRIPLLLQAPATVRFVSAEPLLSSINLGLLGTAPESWGMGYIGIHKLIHQVIVGGETGPGARPMDPDWARDIRDQCKAAGTSYFFKQMSKKAPIPDDLMIREFPKEE